jgi:hypothetical protein
LRKIIIISIVSVICFIFSCSKKEIDMQPGYVLQKWSRAIEKMDYGNYAKCEAYPKSDSVFREIYRDDYFTDIMAVDIEEPDLEKITIDHEGNSYIQRNVKFEGSAVKRNTGKPYQVVSGDAVFIKFKDGKRSSDGWLIFNRTIARINK